jgi:hypothetical protein
MNLYEKEGDYHMDNTVAVSVELLQTYIDFDHPDFKWVECKFSESIHPQDIKEAMRNGITGTNEPYDKDKHFLVDKEWHVRRVIYLVENKQTDPIIVGSYEDDCGNPTPFPVIIDGKHRFMAAVVRGDETINCVIKDESLVKILCSPSVTLGK